MLNSKEKTWLEGLLNRNNAVITKSHLVLTSGKHSDSYINLRVLAGNTYDLRDICDKIADTIKDHEEKVYDSLSFDEQDKKLVIVGPETLGRTLAEMTAIAGLFEFFAWCDMGKDADGNDVALWNPKLNFEDIINGARCYIVDDLLTTAKSVKLVKQLIEKTGGKVEGAVVVVRRSQDVTAETIDNISWLDQLLDVEGFNTYEPIDCPMCEARVPMRLRPGHGHEWIKGREDYPVEE